MEAGLDSVVMLLMIIVFMHHDAIVIVVMMIIMIADNRVPFSNYASLHAGQSRHKGDANNNGNQRFHNVLLGVGYA